MGKKLVPVPCNDFILVDAEAMLEEKTKGGILLPQKRAESERPCLGVVLAVGPGKYVDGKLEPMRLKPGQKIMFQQFPFFEFQDEHEAQRLIFVRELQVVAVLE